MTIAICTECGTRKWGAISPCDHCGFTPASSTERAKSVLLSDHHYLLLVLRELRRQGLTFITFYVLQRFAKYPGISQLQLRRETGLKDYEISRDCKFLADSGLIKIGHSTKDRRVRVLRPTNRGKKIWEQVLSAASKNIQKGLSFDKGLSDAEEDRRLTQISESFEIGQRDSVWSTATELPGYATEGD